jgi:hypothetical protein
VLCLCIVEVRSGWPMSWSDRSDRLAKCTCAFVQLQFYFRILALRAEWRELQMSIICFRLAAAMRSWLRGFFCKSSRSRAMDGHIDGGPYAWIIGPLFICQSAQGCQMTLVHIIASKLPT